MSIICIKNFTKDYGNDRGVFDISLEIEKGDVFGFLGSNGAGKTTTIRALMGFIKPNIGKCYINNLDCFDNANIIQENVGYLSGEKTFMDDMTGKEFIDFIAKYKRIKDLTIAKKIIKEFELDVDIKIKKMSKGMKQKVGIVVAFMGNPDILILDEPTSGLDPLMQNKFVELIREERKKGKTILMSSHIFEEIEKTCTKLAIIIEGRIVAIDDLETIEKSKSKKFVITFINDIELQKFVKEKMNITEKINNQATIIAQNNIDGLIKILAKYKITDLKEEKQNLEDIFIKFYGGADND